MDLAFCRLVAARSRSVNDEPFRQVHQRELHSQAAQLCEGALNKQQRL